MNEIVPFLYETENNHLEPVRVVIHDGEPWFVATDLARILGFRDAANATRTLDDDEKATHNPSSIPGSKPAAGNPNLLIISESGLYALIFRSRKPVARKFRKWVTSQVLPTIRRTGAWGAPDRFPPHLLKQIEGFLHQHQLRALAAVEAIAAASEDRKTPRVQSLYPIAEIAGLSLESVQRSICLLSLLGFIKLYSDDERVRAMLPGEAVRPKAELDEK